MSDAVFSKENIIKIDSRKIQGLKQKALLSPRKTARLCLHKNIRDFLHEMVIVHCKGAYIRPHRHTDKTESFHIIEGSFFLIIFDRHGKMSEKILISEKCKGGCFICRIQKNCWHMMIPISDFIVFHETTKGPYRGKQDSIFALWSPENNRRIAIREFIKKLLMTAIIKLLITR